MTLYQVLLFFHILAIAVWVGDEADRRAKQFNTVRASTSCFCS